MRTKDIAKVIHALDGPVIEIAGPTPGRYKVLDEVSINLPSEPIITNISKRIVIDQYGDSPKKFTVDRVLDVRDQPPKRHTYSVVLCSYLPLDLGQVIKFRSTKEVKPDVLREYKEVISYNGDIKFNVNLHIALFIFAKEALVNGGVLILQGLMHDDNKVATKLNFELLLSKSLERKLDSQIYRFN